MKKCKRTWRNTWSNPSLNENLLKMAPGGNLLLAFAGSMNLDKLKDVMKNFNPPQLDTLKNKMEEMTGMPGDQLLDAFTGDFAIAINGVEGEALTRFQSRPA